MCVCNSNVNDGVFVRLTRGVNVQEKKMLLIICKISIGHRGGICLRLSFIYFSFGEGEGEQNMSY